MFWSRAVILFGFLFFCFLHANFGAFHEWYNCSSQQEFSANETYGVHLNKLPVHLSELPPWHSYQTGFIQCKTTPQNEFVYGLA